MCGFKSLFLKVHSSKAAFVGHFDRFFPKKWNMGCLNPTIITILVPSLQLDNQSSYRGSPIIASLVSQSLSQSLVLLLRIDWCDPGMWRFTHSLQKSCNLSLPFFTESCQTKPVAAQVLWTYFVKNLKLKFGQDFEAGFCSSSRKSAR